MKRLNACRIRTTQVFALAACLVAVLTAPWAVQTAAYSKQAPPADTDHNSVFFDSPNHHRNHLHQHPLLPPKQRHRDRQGPAMTQEKRLIAYYTSWCQYPPRNYSPLDIPVELITHINYAFANIVDGRVALGDSWGDVEKPHQVDHKGEQITLLGNFGVLNDPRSPLRKRNPALKTLISVGGWTWSKDFSMVARTAQARNVFVQSAVEFVVKHGFDGIDLDWEWPGVEREGVPAHPDDGKNYTLLLEALRHALDEEKRRAGRNNVYLLTVATGASEAAIAQLDMRGLARTCDWVNVMTYDNAGIWSSKTDHHASVPFALSSIDGYVRRGLPASQVTHGIPFYARSFAHVHHLPASHHPAPRPGLSFQGAGSGTHEAGVVDFDDIQAKYAAPAGSYHHAFDSDAGASTWWCADKKEWMSGESEQSAETKGRLVVERGFAGAFWWEQSMDKQARLVKAIRRGIKRAGKQQD
ncbi:glycosyl hydrolases family 18-domain-containing protein [Catenaria anguillulae PL171]|uniref:Glycosyl hydrolases family 18-domain-containing protein n=1 Tax=Catenaria anguillulae PL171 TaxID=765915 RepID=A0A1Y2HSU3_9FUNG|nr:glycosyl hydrolases family 18-domain-containing protein [Catenaria anguillulae PL171]